jgi:hypothetical protein
MAHAPSPTPTRESKFLSDTASMPYPLKQTRYRCFPAARISPPWTRRFFLASAVVVFFAQRFDCTALDQESGPALLKDVTTATFESKLKSLGPSPGMMTETMLAHLGINPKEMEWDMGAYGGILYWARFEGGTREISLLCAEPSKALLVRRMA